MRNQEFGGGLTPNPEHMDLEQTELSQVSSVDREAITERIIDKVIDAAENNEPIEKGYELSHELKDKADYSQAVSLQPMESVGSILQQNIQSRPSAIDQTYLQTTSDESITNQVSQSSLPTTKSAKISYQKAVLYGFLAAVIVCITGLFALLT